MEKEIKPGTILRAKHDLLSRTTMNKEYTVIDCGKDWLSFQGDERIETMQSGRVENHFQIKKPK